MFILILAFSLLSVFGHSSDPSPIALCCKVIPQAICTRYGLAVGANFVWLVRILMIVCYPIAYPIGKVIYHQR